VEFLVGWALGDDDVFWHGNGEFVVGFGITLFRTHAFTVGVFQESFLTETPYDALEGTNLVWLRVGAVWNAGGTTSAVFGIGSAFRRDGESKPEGANAEQQRESKARIHR